MAAGDRMNNRLIGRLAFLGGFGAWAWRAVGLLPGHLHKFNYLDSVDQGLRGTSEWVHPLFVPLLGAGKAFLGLFGYSGSMLAPLAAINLAAGGVTLAVLFLLAERLSRDSFLSAASVLALAFSPSFLTGTLGMNPYALAAACSTAALALLAGPPPADERRRYALAGAAAGLAVGLHTAAIALAPVAALAAWRAAGPPSERAPRLKVFLKTLAAVVLSGYAVFMAYHGIVPASFRSSELIETLRGIEQMRGSSIFTSRDIGKQLWDFWSTLRDGPSFLLILAVLAALRGAASLRRGAPRLEPGQGRGAALSLACTVSYALFFIINSSNNGFNYVVLLPVPLLLAVLACGAPFLRALLVLGLLGAVTFYWDRVPSSFSEVRSEARFLDALMRPGDVLVLPGRPVPDLLYLRDFPILQAGGSPCPECSVVPVVPLEALPRMLLGILGRGRRVFFQAGDIDARFPDGQEGIDFAVRRRRLFAVDGAGPAEQAQWVRAVRRRLEETFSMDCGHRSAQGWEYCRLRPRAGARPGPGPAAAPSPLSWEDMKVLGDALLSVRSGPFARRKTSYLLGWLERFPGDAFLQDEFGRLAAVHAGEMRSFRDRGRALHVLRLLSRIRPGDAGILIDRAELLSEAGRRREALEEWGRAETSAAAEPDLQRLAESYRRFNETARYLRVLEVLSREGPEDAGLQLKRAELLSAEGKRQEALAALARVPVRGLDEARLERAAGLYWKLGEHGALAEFIARAGRDRRLDAGLWLRGAQAARLAGRREAAARALARAEESGLDDASLERAVDLYWELGEHAALADLLMRAGRDRRLDAGLWLRGAQAARLAGRREAAARALARAEESGLDDARLRQAADLYWELGEHAALADLLMRAGRDRRLDAGLWLRGAQAARLAGRREAAARALARAEASGLGDANLGMAADLYWELGEHAALAGLIARAGPVRRLDGGLWAKRAEEALRGGVREGARAALAALAAAETSPRIEPALLCRMGMSARASGDMRTARRILERMEADPGQDTGFWLSLARVAVLAGDDEAAEHALRRASGPEGGALPDARSRLLLLEGRVGRRVADAAVLAGLAGMAARQGEEAQARGYLKDAEKAAASSEDIRSVALAYQQVRDYASALRLYDRLIARDPAQARWLNDRGVLKALLGRTAGAVADLEAALARDPSLLTAYLTLGSLYAAQGDRQGARRCYEQAARRADSRTPAAILRMIERARAGKTP
jgi:tetratricopeptide (TPR) repeat protein